MYVHTVPNQSTNTSFCLDRYSYLPIARCDLYYTDELIAGTLKQNQVLYGQQLLHARKCSSLVYKESFTRMPHWN